MASLWQKLFGNQKQFEQSASIPLYNNSYGYKEPPQNYEAFAKNGYGKNAIIYSCIRELTNAAIEPRYFIEGFDRENQPFEIQDSPLKSLLDAPNKLKIYTI